MLKEELTLILENIATFLELNAENPFKIRAYNMAAHTLANLDEDLNKVVEEGRLRNIEGIGEAIAAKIVEYINTGKIDFFEALKAQTPPGFLELLKVPGLGPKKIHTFYTALGVSNLEELEDACLQNRLKDLPGMGLKTQEKILHGVGMVKANRGKYLYPLGSKIAEEIIKELSPLAINISAAGSLRRFKELVKDIDIVASTKDKAALISKFTSLLLVQDIIQKGDNKASVVTRAGINVDLLVVSEEEFPYALHHFTGSKKHNVAMRSLAKSLNYKINEYGVYKENTRLEVKNEEELYSIFGMSYIPPEMREDTGEIEAAKNGSLPVVINEEDILGVFHVHSAYSDGLTSLRDMRQAAKKLGFKYLGISDHSQTASYAGGLKLEDIKRQGQEIVSLNAEDSDFVIFKGIESDILPDGSLDYPEEILQHFDFVIGSVHSRFNMSEKEMTARVVKALNNKYLTILGHPTGRLLLAREGYPINMEEVLQTASANGKCIEINASPNRLDLDWHWCRRAKEMEIRIVISPDAHHQSELLYYKYGVKVAKKAWLTKDDVTNTWGVNEVRAFLHLKHP